MTNPTSCFNLYDIPLPIPSHIRNFSTDECRCIGINSNGSNMTIEELNFVWSNINCNEVFYRLYYPPGGGVITFNPLLYSQVEEDMKYLLSKYFNKTPLGYTLAVPGQNGYNPFQDILIQSCTANGGIDTNGICNKGLLSLCTNCSREEIADSTNLLRLCGCYAPQLDPVEYPGITRACDSLCSQARVAQFRDPITGIVDSCNEGGICVINSISITASKSAVGDTQFNQICPMCVNAPSCKCIVDVTIASLPQQAGIGDTATFNQFCGTNSQCIVINNNTQAVETVPCQDNIDELKPQTYNFPVSRGFWIVVILIILLFFIVILALRQAFNYDIMYVTPNNITTYPNKL